MKLESTTKTALEFSSLASANIAPAFLLEVTLTKVQSTISTNTISFRAIAPAVIWECKLMNFEFLITVFLNPLTAVEYLEVVFANVEFEI